jgi:hypothetical protein
LHLKFSRIVLKKKAPPFAAARQPLRPIAGFLAEIRNRKARRSRAFL